MVLPAAAYLFTIPSVHDDSLIEGRIYHPVGLEDAFDGKSPPKLVKAAVLAHPYAPLGGSFDDHIVSQVARELLSCDYIVGTFNFRGAGASESKTSWSGKAELDDYISFTVLLANYVRHLSSARSYESLLKQEHASSEPVTGGNGHTQVEYTTAAEHNETRLQLILGGYSYGSLIVANLPKTHTIMERFAKPHKSSADGEILLRAQNLASQTAHDLERALQQRRVNRGPLRAESGNREKRPGISIGGDEGPRRSHDSRLSTDRIRSLDIPRTIRTLATKKKSSEVLRDSDDVAGHEAVAVKSTSYLLISPILPPLSTMLGTSLGHGMSGKALAPSNRTDLKSILAVWGGEDFFTSGKRLRAWADKARESGAKLEYEEISNAGHFWREAGVETKLIRRIGKWVRDQEPRSTDAG